MKTAKPAAGAAGFRSFELEAQDVMSRQGTRRAQAVVRAALLVVALLIGWAAWATLDEVTRGDAKVIPSRQLQLVQSFDGGVVAEILVREGALVEKDQVLLKIDETRAVFLRGRRRFGFSIEGFSAQDPEVFERARRRHRGLVYRTEARVGLAHDL